MENQKIINSIIHFLKEGEEVFDLFVVDSIGENNDK